MLLTTWVAARFLMPEHYAAAAIVLSTTAFFELLSQFGFAQAIIGVKDRSERFVNTCFTTSLLLASVLYLILFLVSPFIERYYSVVDLSLFLRINGLLLFLTLVTAIPFALLERDLNFKSFALVNWFTSVGIFLTTVPMALGGMGVWVLIIPRLVGVTLGGVLALWFARYLPKISFSIDALKKSFNFGISALISNFTNYISNHTPILLMGKVWAQATLGVFSFVNNNYRRPLDIISAQFTSSLFPILVRVSDRTDLLRMTFLGVIRIGFFLITPLYVVFIVGAQVIVPGVFGDQWVQAIVPFQILCCLPIIRILTFGVSNTLYAINLPHLTARISAIRMVLIVSLLFIFFLMKLDLVKTLIWLIIPETLIVFYYHLTCIRRLESSVLEVARVLLVPMSLNLGLALALGVAVVGLKAQNWYNIWGYLIAASVSGLGYLTLAQREFRAQINLIRNL